MTKNQGFRKRVCLWMAALALTVSTSGWAQKAGLQQSTICHDDGTVTFQYENPTAREVFVDVQFAGRNKMERDAKTGIWTVTLGPAAPDMYP